MAEGMTRREREVCDPEEIRTILDKAKVLHLGLCEGNEPYVVPMNYGYTLTEQGLTLYLHGARRGKKLDMMRANDCVFFELCCDITPFAGDVACRYGTAYASVMGRGRARILQDTEEKKQGLTTFMRTQTGKEFTFEDRMVEVVSVIRIDVESFTAKRRPLPAGMQEVQK